MFVRVSSGDGSGCPEAPDQPLPGEGARPGKICPVSLAFPGMTADRRGRTPARATPRPRSDRFGSESPLSATWRPAVLERAVLAGLGSGGEEMLDELAA